MNRYHYYDNLVIWLSFFVAIIMQIIPWPLQLYFFYPYWIKILLIYWVMSLPKQVNIGTSFVLGILVDIILGSLIGIHALAFSILAYLTVFAFRLFRNIALLQQTIIVILLSLITQGVIFLAEFLVNNISFHIDFFLGSIIDGIFWPWLCFLMRKIR